VLASASPRRRTLLAALGLDPEVDPPDVDEDLDAWSDPERAAAGLAERKAAVVAARHRDEPVVVLAADTVVVVGDDALAKPTDDDDARAMLARLSGRWHRVITGVAVVDVASGRRWNDVHATEVRMRDIAPAELDAYVATGEWRGLAGGYAIQGRAAVFIDRIVGEYSNVVGLPLAATAAVLAEAGIDVVGGWAGGGAPAPDPGTG